LVGIIGKAMQKNRRYRYQSATAIKNDLQELQKRLEVGGFVPSRLRISTDTFQGSHRRLAIVQGLVAAVMQAVVGEGSVWWVRNRDVTPPPENSVAVLPFKNLNHDPRLDNLRFTLADAITRVLAANARLTVRPSSETQKYTDDEVDARQAGRDLRSAVVVSGHFVAQGERLTITLEAVDIATNAVVWQGTVPSITDNAAITQAQVVAQVRHGLLPALRAESSKK
jgi:TolB-like protein